MLLLHSKSITPRLQYVVNFFSQELFDEPILVTSNKLYYINYDGPKINYHYQELCNNEFLVSPVPLLFETVIKEQDTSCFEINFHKAFFQTTGDIHFDIFAAIFYLLSRYEEYMPHPKDVHGRFMHTSSLAFREDFLHQPLVNIWLQEFKNSLSLKFPDLKFRGKQFANVITYDVDIAYSYMHKGLWRNLGGTVRSLMRGEWSLIVERWQVLFKIKKDPFDCFEWLDAMHLYCRIKPYYFFLVARKPTRYDKNVSTSARSFRDLIEYYSSTYNVGVHPSWQSGDDHALLKEEIEWLEVISDKKIRASRQHYLRFFLPETYRRLINEGIEKEFSMGYGTINGFRASVSSPFNWYDLENEEETNLVIYPFCFMDANAFYETRSSPKEAYEELMRYYDSVKRVNGMFITLWHNHLLGSDRRTAGWNQMFELFMREVVYWDAYADGR
ncbi:MAG: hypothetical protein H0X41_08615 [Chitinophagaceae bacterium]|nr:hypothetical protein [Chitinophagaceae bacterium]